MEVPREARELVRRIDTILNGMPESCTVPLCCDRNGYTVPHGSGTLIQLGEGSYLITAKHVFSEVAAAGSRVFVGGLQGATVFELPQAVHFTRRKSLADAAAWRLRPEDVPLFSAKRFLGLEDLWLYDFPIVPDRGPFVLHGFLADLAGAGGGPTGDKGYVNAARLYMSTYEGVPPAKFYDPRTHLLFTSDLKYQFRADGQVATVPTSKLLGVSGAGVYRVAREHLRNRLVAIGTDVLPRLGLFQGTRVKVFLELIGSKYPDAAEAIMEYCRITDPTTTT